MKKLLFTISSLLLTLSLLAFSTLNIIEGDRIDVNDARSISMGSTGVSDYSRIGNLSLNPAIIAFSSDKLNCQLNFNLSRDNEKRSLPMYNSFDAYSGDAVYISNTHFFDNYGFHVSYKYVLNSEISLATAFSYNPLISFDAEYEEEVRNNANSDNNTYPPIIAKNFLSGEGNINDLEVSLAAKFRKTSLGMTIHILNGTADYNKKLIWSDYSEELLGDQLEDNTIKGKREFSKTHLSVGVMQEIYHDLFLGMSYTPSTKFDVEGKMNGINVDEAVYVYYFELDSLGYILTDSTTYDYYKNPLSIKIGASFHPKSSLRTTFNFDLEYVGWENVNDLYSDALNFYVGVEHNFTNGIPFRFGFKNQTCYNLGVFAVQILSPSFSCGTGFSLINKLKIDLGFEVEKKTYYSLDLFPDSAYDYPQLWSNYSYMNLQDRGWENPDSVSEILMKFALSVNYKF